MSVEMPAALAPPSIDQVPPARAPAVVDLLLRPEVYFKERRPVIPARWAPLFILVLGMAAGIDRGDSIFESRFSGRGWLAYWGLVLGLAIWSGPIHWFLGSYWFRLRLRFSGVRRPDVSQTRAIFVMTHMIYAVPLLGGTVLESVGQEAPGEGEFLLTILVGLVWSQLAAYRALRAVYPNAGVKRLRVWFLAFPGLFLGGMFGYHFLATLW